MPENSAAMFSLQEQVIIVTGGAGLLGRMHTEAILGSGGIPVILDRDQTKLQGITESLCGQTDQEYMTLACDITHRDELTQALSSVLERFGRVDGLVNNAANNPVAGGSGSSGLTRFEDFDLQQWHADVSVGLTGAMLCCQIFGTHMASAGSGSIVNIASDLALIAPDQRLYQQAGLEDNQQPVKPVSYSVIKSGLLGLTRYLATYWADRGVRVNAISPGGIYQQQDPEFVDKLTALIPMGRMAEQNEVQGSLVYLLSSASSYVTGTNLVVDGGRTCW